MPTHPSRHLVARVAFARRQGLAARRRRVPNTRAPKLIESDYAARLVAIVDRVRSEARHVIDDLPTLLRVDSEIRLDDDQGRRARRRMERVRAEADGSTNDTQLEGLAHGFGRRVSEHQRADLARQGRAALGIDVVTLDPKVGDVINGFAHENVTLIKSLQGRVLDDIEKIVVRAVASGTRAEDVQAEIVNRFGVAERHARLIARDQIGRLHSQIARARHEELGIEAYDWQHIGNKNPRPHHVARHGKRFRYAEPPSDGHPGIAICCHCLAKPAFDDILSALAA
jgi:SPP1 gp7 family putative phage head morphogenesis protein